jgi:hypothetical protein
MALAPRNAPCPCGSGRKYKKCCGFDRAHERLLEERLDVLEQLALLPFHEPRLRPLSATFDAWARAVIAGTIAATPDEAVESIGDEERRRILAVNRDELGASWDELALRAGAELVNGAVLAGAAAAGVRDLRPPPTDVLELLEELDEVLAEPLDALSWVIGGEALWSRRETELVESGIHRIPDWLDDDAYEARWRETIVDFAAGAATEWHARRLARLVERARRRLPYDGFPATTAAVSAGCERFDADTASRARLAALLLEDTIGTSTAEETREALLAA